MVIDAGAGTVSALGADGATLQPAVLADDPRVVGSSANLSSSNVPTMDRMSATSSLNLTSGSAYAVRTVVRKTGMYSRIRFCTASTAPVGITDLRAAVFSTTSYTAISQTLNIAALATAGNTIIEAALATPIGLTLGSQVMLGLGFVGTTLQVRGAALSSALAGLDPVLAKTGSLLLGGELTTVGGSATGNIVWMELLP